MPSRSSDKSNNIGSCVRNRHVVADAPATTVIADGIDACNTNDVDIDIEKPFDLSAIGEAEESISLLSDEGRLPQHKLDHDHHTHQHRSNVRSISTEYRSNRSKMRKQWFYGRMTMYLTVLGAFMIGTQWVVVRETAGTVASKSVKTFQKSSVFGPSAPKQKLDALTELLGCPSAAAPDKELCLQERMEDMKVAHANDLKIKETLLEQARNVAVNGSLTDSEIKPIISRNRIEPKYRPEPGWSALFPHFNIVGRGKAGTSHLYNVMSLHPDARPLHPKRKEYCAAKNMAHGWNYPEGMSVQLQANLFDYYQSIETLVHSGGDEEKNDKKVVNGCIATHEVVLHEQYLSDGLPSHAKYFYLFRDPADLAWAAWNFWRDPDLDMHNDPRNKGNRAREGSHYRSPELFHELIASQGLLDAFHGGNHMFEAMTTAARMLKGLVGSENILYLRNEDMRPENVKESGFVDKLSAFTGLHKEGFYEMDILFSATNCNGSTKASTECKSSKASSSTYSIAGNRTMLPKTRELIYLKAYEHCKIWFEELGIEYKECLSAV